MEDEFINRAYVYFGLRWKGPLDPDEITAWIGVTPTEVFREGPRTSTQPPRMVSGWSFSTPEMTADSLRVDQMVGSIVEALSPFRDRIREAVEKWNLKATLQVVTNVSVASKASSPIVSFSKEVVRFVADVGGCIDEDRYKLAAPFAEYRADTGGVDLIRVTVLNAVEFPGNYEVASGSLLEWLLRKADRLEESGPDQDRKMLGAELSMHRKGQPAMKLSWRVDAAPEVALEDGDVLWVESLHFRQSPRQEEQDPTLKS